MMSSGYSSPESPDSTLDAPRASPPPAPQSQAICPPHRVATTDAARRLSTPITSSTSPTTAQKVTVYAPFLWQETGVDHHSTLSGHVQIIFAHGQFMAKRMVRDDRQYNQLNRLAQLLPNCPLPEFIRLYGVVNVKPSNNLHALITELCPITLHELIHKLHYRPPREILISLLMDVANICHFIHRRNFIHGELTSTSLWVSDNCGCKLGDVGVDILNPSQVNRKPLTMVPNVHSAPEVVEGHFPTYLSDIYSFGALAAELATGYPMMTGCDLNPVLDSMNWEPLVELLRKCVRHSPDTRPPDFQTVLAELKLLQSSLENQNPCDISPFKQMLCDYLQRSRKLIYFPSLYWTYNALQDHRSENNIPLQGDFQLGTTPAKIPPLDVMVLQRVSQLETEWTNLQQKDFSTLSTLHSESQQRVDTLVFRIQTLESAIQNMKALSTIGESSAPVTRNDAISSSSLQIAELAVNVALLQKRLEVSLMETRHMADTTSSLALRATNTETAVTALQKYSEDTTNQLNDDVQEMMERATALAMKLSEMDEGEEKLSLVYEEMEAIKERISQLEAASTSEPPPSSIPPPPPTSGTDSPSYRSDMLLLDERISQLETVLGTLPSQTQCNTEELGCLTDRISNMEYRITELADNKYDPPVLTAISTQEGEGQDLVHRISSVEHTLEDVLDRQNEQSVAIAGCDMRSPLDELRHRLMDSEETLTGLMKTMDILQGEIPRLELLIAEHEMIG